MLIGDHISVAMKDIVDYSDKNDVTLSTAQDELKRTALYSVLSDMRYKEGNFEKATDGVVLDALLELLMSSVELPMR
tara:strand:- start:361 stop:591 length:231 start_codon:yes stop_codon:yes gene_type:complete